MTKLKKLIKNNWIITLYYLIGFAGAVIIGWLLGRPNMLHAGTFTGTNITYDDGQVLVNNSNDGYSMITERRGTYGVYQATYGWSGSIRIYSDCSYYNNVLTCYKLSSGTYGSMTASNNVNITFTFSTNSYVASDYSTVTWTIMPTGSYTQEDLDDAYSDGVTAGENNVTSNPHDYGLYDSTDTANYFQAGVSQVLSNPNDYGLYSYSQYTLYGQNRYSAGYADGFAHSDYQTGYNTGYNEGYSRGRTDGYYAGEQWVLDHLSDYDLYTEQDYLDYGNSKYQEGYQAGVTAGENNVTSNPNDYDLYTEQQYLNNGSYSDFIENQISSVWVNQPVLNNGYYNNNWIKINNSNLVINEGTIQLDTLYTNNNNITGIRIYFKSYFTNDLPLSFNNIIDPSDYQYTSVYLKCIIELPNNTMNDDMSNMCQTTPGITSEINYLELEYKYLINNINYFEALANTGDVNYNYYNYLKYNCLEISNISTSGNSLNYLNGTLNTINYDITSINLTSYNMGYDKGYRYGQQANNQAEFNRGYNKGYDDAEQLYADTSGNGNTLVGLAGTILFSPVQMMKDVFNFEILGVNLAGFILSIITLIVVAWLIKRLI